MDAEKILTDDQAAALDSSQHGAEAEFGEHDLTASDVRLLLPEQPRARPNSELTDHTSVVESDETSNTPDVAPTQLRQPPIQSPPEVRVYAPAPGRGFHERRMESRLAPDFPGDRDPSRYISPRCYRRHLNTELSKSGAPFLLGEPFFEGSSGGIMWREGEAKISPTQEHLTHSGDFCSRCYSGRAASPKVPEEQLVLFCEVENLWPGAQFGDFIFKATP